MRTDHLARLGSAGSSAGAMLLLNMVIYQGVSDGRVDWSLVVALLGTLVALAAGCIIAARHAPHRPSRAQPGQRP